MPDHPSKRTIVLVRHGKANPSPPAGSNDDFDRTLNQRGAEQARFVGAELAQSLVAGRVVVSDAVRTTQTGALIADAMGLTATADPRLHYSHAPSTALVAIADHLAQVASDRATVFVSHNPLLGDLLGLIIDGLGAPSWDVRTGEAFVVELAGDDLVGGGTLLRSLRLSKSD